MILFYIYKTCLALLYPLTRLAGLLSGSSSLRERLGYYSEAQQQSLSIGYNVWVHAASAGEVNAILPFCRAFRSAKPESRIVLTTTSQTGKKLALEKGIADYVFLAPLDMTRPLRRAFEAFRPLMVLVAETELWPNWLIRAGKNGIPILLVNGRISDKSFPSYQRLKSLFSTALNCFSACLVQTPKDAERLAVLGVSSKRIQVMGQMKYDLQAPNPSDTGKFKVELGLGEKEVLFTLGSLREGEEDQLLPLVPEILGFAPEVKVLIAPRHVKNAAVYRQKLEALGAPGVLRSEWGKNRKPERVIVLDTVGELSLAYALSRGAFVGGTLVEIGGHNVMEPALSSVPVCFGPSTQNVEEAAQALIGSGGGLRIGSALELVDAFRRFMDPTVARETGRKAYEAVAAMRGATERTVREVLDHWPIGLEIRRS